VLGGGGNDTINCGAGTDVAIGGPGVDTFNNNCETQIQ
jgi:Ca2+-binding RTX toxin-like protein